MVADHAGVQLAVGVAGLRQHVGLDDVVLGVLAVEVDVSGQPVAEEFELCSHFEGCRDCRLDGCIHLGVRLIHCGQAMRLGAVFVGRIDVVGAQCGTHLRHGSSDFPEVQPRSVYELACHERDRASSIEVGVAAVGQSGVDVVAYRAVKVDEVVPAHGRGSEERACLEVCLLVVRAVGVGGSRKVEETWYGQATVSVAVEVIVVVFPGLGEDGGLHGKAVAHIVPVPCGVCLGGEVVGLGVVRAEVRTEIRRALAVFRVVAVGCDVVVHPHPDADIARQQRIDISGHQMVAVVVEDVVVVQGSVRIVVEVRREIVLTDNVPCPPAVVRPEVVLQFL